MKLIGSIVLILFICIVIYFAKKHKANSTNIDTLTKGLQKSVSDIFKTTDPEKFANELGYYYASKEDNKGFGSLNKEQRIVAAIWNLEAEINNGGFDQFYSNPTGDHALFTEEALSAIGSKKVLGFLKEANATFPDEKPSADREARCK